MKKLLTAERLKKELSADIDIEIFESVDSTNNIAKERIVKGCRPWHTVAALSQTEGQGRLGRSFFSPVGSGLYFSVVLYPESFDIGLITGAAAVAVCEALESVFGLSPRIKWVNDILINEKKVCGILAKGLHMGEKSAVVLGIGLNLFFPEGGFPEDIRDRAGYLFSVETEGIREKLFAAILERLMDRIENQRAEIADEYRKRCATIGKTVDVIFADSAKKTRIGRALDTDDRFHLLLEYENGEREVLSSGEVSVRI